MYPQPFQKLIDNFSNLPSIGPKLAERLVLYLFKQNDNQIKELSQNINNLKNLKTCSRCFNLSENNLCKICRDSQRDQKTLCVVEDPLDIFAIERTKTYTGLYYVLGGTAENPEKIKYLKIPQLLQRIKKENIKEIIIATNPTTEGDLTALYLKRKLKPFQLKVTRLARGLSTGGDIEYADEITLSSALDNRKEM